MTLGTATVTYTSGSPSVGMIDAFPVSDGVQGPAASMGSRNLDFCLNHNGGLWSSVDPLANLGAHPIVADGSLSYSWRGCGRRHVDRGHARENRRRGGRHGHALRCAAGTIIRLGTKTNVGGASQYPAAADAAISVRGPVTVPAVRHYQVWYRDAAAFCTASTFNLTNGVAISRTL